MKKKPKFKAEQFELPFDPKEFFGQMAIESLKEAARLRKLEKKKKKK